MRLLRSCARPHLRPYGTTTAPPSPTRLEKIIRDMIKATGPMSVSTYMQLCLSHPTEGYYMNPANSVFGSRGDFITSPEISQVFGELVGVWHLSRWLAAGQPLAIRIVELGPGRGTLLDDALRALSQFRACASALRTVHLVETSPTMRNLQKAKLAPLGKEHKWDTLWHDSVDELLEEKLSDTGVYTMVIAHEFFDALPIHVLERSSDGWHEVLVASAPDAMRTTVPGLLQTPSSSFGSALESPLPPLRLVRSPGPTATSRLLAASSPRFATLPVGARLEVSLSSFKIARKVTELLGTPGAGAALIIDYGGDKAFGGSLRAFREHRIVDIFDRPGHCDLTANVDFAYVKEAMAGAAATHGPLEQSKFLKRMGLDLRVDTLKRAAKSEERKGDIERATRRLVDLTGMGREYKVLGVTAQAKANEGLDDIWPFMDLGDGERTTL